MNTAKQIIILTSIFMLTGLSGYPVMAYDSGPSQYGIAEGSSVTLHVPLTIEARGHQVFIQGGEIKKEKTYSYSSAYNEYYPFCYFEINSPSNEVQTILPGEFVITRVTTGETEIVQSTSTQVASLLYLAGGTPSQIVEILIMELRSTSQPNVEQLVCADGFNDPGEVVMPTLKQIRDTLGQVATLKLAQ